METTLAMLAVFGIFVGIPTVIGLVMAGGYILADRRAGRAARARALREVGEVLRGLDAPVHGEVQAEKPTEVGPWLGV